MRRTLGLNRWKIFLLLGVLVAATILVIAVLILFLIPARIDRVSVKAFCGTHLKAQASAFAVYAAMNSDTLPGSNVKLSSMCEQSVGTRDAIVSAAQTTNVTRLAIANVQKWFYCPANAAQNPAKLWDAGGVSRWGYVWMNDRGAGAGLPTTFPARKVPLEYVSELNKAPRPAEAILVQDVVVTDTDKMPLNYAPKRAAVSFGTNHLKDGKPNGVNVWHPDGSVEWVAFDEKTAVAVRQPGGGYFWFPGP